MILKKNTYRLLIRARQQISLGSISLHNNENYHPFFIIGSGRSGNTLLRRILNNHPKLFIPPETYELGRSIRQSLKYPMMSWIDLVSLIYSNIQFNPEFETFGIKDLGELYRRVCQAENTQRSVAYIINSFYEYYREKHGIRSERWGDKTPLNTLSLDEIHAVFPNAKFVHIVRNPVDCISSYLRAGVYSEIKTATSRWRRSIEAATRFGKKSADQYFEINYENLVRNPDSVVEQVCSFLDVDFQPELLSSADVEQLGDVAMREHHKNVSKPINTNSIGNGYQQFSPAEIQTIKHLLMQSKNKRLHNILSQYHLDES